MCSKENLNKVILHKYLVELKVQFVFRYYFLPGTVLCFFSPQERIFLTMRSVNYYDRCLFLQLLLVIRGCMLGIVGD